MYIEASPKQRTNLDVLGLHRLVTGRSCVAIGLVLLMISMGPLLARSSTGAHGTRVILPALLDIFTSIVHPSV